MVATNVFVELRLVIFIRRIRTVIGQLYDAYRDGACNITLYELENRNVLNK